MPVGTIAISAGAALAGSNYFTLTLKGRSSHAAAPYEGDDLPVVAAHCRRGWPQAPIRRNPVRFGEMVDGLGKDCPERFSPCRSLSDIFESP
jgi:metal-dependent amidase/aminoacylase/carboxypeptidase family protein